MTKSQKSSEDSYLSNVGSLQVPPNTRVKGSSINSGIVVTRSSDPPHYLIQMSKDVWYYPGVRVGVDALSLNVSSTVIVNLTSTEGTSVSIDSVSALLTETNE